MSKLNSLTPIAAVLALSVTATGCSTMAEKPASAGHHGDKSAEAKCGEGKCAGGFFKKLFGKSDEAKCGEGTCGGKSAEAKCGGDKAAEAKCGGDKAKEAKCGGDKTKEAKCGEAKCGAK